MSAPRIPTVRIESKRVGRIDTGDACGFAEHEGDPFCGAPPSIHGQFNGTWEGTSSGFACEEHADAMLQVADRTHVVSPTCYRDACGFPARSR